MPDFPEISPLDLLAALASPTPPAVLDIRLAEDVALDATRIPTAIAMSHEAEEDQIDASMPNGAVVICHKGLKLSAGVTARLLGRGIAAYRLAGGHVGWTSMGLPTLSHLPRTRLVISLDASAADVLQIWATLRFDAPSAELLEVPRDDLDGVVMRFDATPPGSLSPPDVRGLSRLRVDLGLLTEALRAGPRPSTTFPILDLAYRGALRHDSVTGLVQANGTEPRL